MKLLEPEDFKKLCFDILKKYQNRNENFLIHWDQYCKLYGLELLEPPLKTKKDYYKKQMKIYVQYSGDVQVLDFSGKFLYSIPELINILEKDTFRIIVTLKNKKKISSRECIYELFGKYIFVKRDEFHFPHQFEFKFLESVVYANDYKPATYTFFKFYLLDPAEATIYLL